MAIKTELVIHIRPDGKVEIKTHGLKGADCEAELKPIEQALGRVANRERTSEYYEQSLRQNVKKTTSAK